MKKRLLAIALLGLALQGFSQTSLKAVATGGEATTKYFTRLLQYQPNAAETLNLTANSVEADSREAYSNAATESGGSTYCASAGLSTANEYINLVNFAGSDYVSGNNGGYGDFTSVVSDVTAGQVTSIQVRAGFTGAVRKEAWTLYIDYNADGDFADAGERLGPVAVTSASILTKTFKIPATAKNGITRMRVQMHYNTGITNPCATFNLGEVEDYSVNITGGRSVAEPTTELISGISVSPNPVISSVARLDYTLAKAGSITFTLTDANGLQKGVYNAGKQDKGINTYQLNNLSGLHNGYYYITVQQDGVVIGKMNLLIAH